MKTTLLLDVTPIYSETGAVTELSERPAYHQEGDGPSSDFTIDIPDEMREDAEELNDQLRDDDAPPDGNARIIGLLPENEEFLAYLLGHGALLIEEGYETDYPETAETIEFDPSGPWTAYRSRNVAFFVDEEDADGYEEALRRYQEEGREGRAA